MQPINSGFRLRVFRSFSATVRDDKNSRLYTGVYVSFECANTLARINQFSHTLVLLQ